MGNKVFAALDWHSDTPTRTDQEGSKISSASSVCSKVARGHRRAACDISHKVLVVSTIDTMQWNPAGDGHHERKCGE
jgi:hypothetical protein